MDPSASATAQLNPEGTPPALPAWLPAWTARLPGWARRPAVLASAGAGLVAVIAIVAVAVGAGLVRGAHGPAPRLTLPIAGASPTAAPSSSGAAPSSRPAASPSPTGPDPPGSPPSAATVTVHAAGAVVSPGIYTVPPSARVADVITAAGGSLPEADLDRVNLAERVADGERVYVPRRGEPDPAGGGASGTGASLAGTGAASGGTGPTAAAPLDLNTATADQLDTLPGVGPATAQAIITYRTRHGRFRSVTELLEVPGIGPAKLEAVRALVRV